VCAACKCSSGKGCAVEPRPRPSPAIVRFRNARIPIRNARPSWVAAEAMRRRLGSSGMRPSPAFMFSGRWAAFEVAGIAHAIAGCETNYFSRTCGQVSQSSSDAQTGSGFRRRWAKMRIQSGVTAMEARFLELADRELGRNLDKILACVGKLDDAQVWWRPHEGSNSVGNLLLHLTGNLSQWVLAGLGGRAFDRRRAEEFAARGSAAGKDEIVGRLADVVADCRKVLKELSASDLRAARTIQGDDTDGLGAIFHVVEHLGYHTGQIVLLAKELAGPRAEIEFYPHLRGK
jgi:uncharacterized damage-inducible protein DinB